MNRRGFFGTCAAVAAAANALPDLANLEPVGPFGERICHGELTTYYRSCDFCYGSAGEDIWAGKSEPEWRKFYRSESECGLIVCEHCLPEYVAGA